MRHGRRWAIPARALGTYQGEASRAEREAVIVSIRDLLTRVEAIAARVRKLEDRK